MNTDDISRSYALETPKGLLDAELDNRVPTKDEIGQSSRERVEYLQGLAEGVIYAQDGFGYGITQVDSESIGTILSTLDVMRNVREAISACMRQAGIDVLLLEQLYPKKQPKPSWSPAVQKADDGMLYKVSIPGGPGIILAPMSHPNLSQERLVSTANNRRVSIVQRESEIETLAEIQNCGWQEKVGFLLDAMRGAKYMHDLEWIHGDIKPANVRIQRLNGGKYGVLFDLEGIVKLKNGQFFKRCPTMSTDGYCEDGYYQERFYGDAARDVFLFGLSLLEILIRMGNISDLTGELLSHCNKYQGTKNRSTAIALKIRDFWNFYRIAGVPDTILDLILSMVDADRSKRPSLDNVIVRLEEILKQHPANGR